VAETTTTETWGVSVAEVTALAPHIAVNADPEPEPVARPGFGKAPAGHVTPEQVDRWIGDVSARVSLRLHRRDRVDEAMLAKVTAAAHDLVVNGAGSYLVAAAFPVKAGLNDNTSYSAELWRRFTDGLNELAKAIDDWIEDNPGTGPGADAGTIVGSFPEPRFADDVAW
jgi:hypothetical protein